MRRSKLLALALVSVGFLASCVKPTTGSSGQNDDKAHADATSMFIIKDIKGTGTATQIPNNSVWKIHRTVKFTMQACIQDKSSRVDARQIKFNVEIPGTTTIIPTQTDAYGCLTWDDPIDYNHYAGQSGWVEIQRTIVGEGALEGKQTVSLLVNPWAAADPKRDSSQTVIFKREGTNYFHPPKVFEPQVGVQAFAGDLQGTASLFAWKANINAIPESEDGQSVGYKLELEMDPLVKSMQADGSPTYDKIQDGKFDVRIQVLAVNAGKGMNEKMVILGGDLHASAISVAGHLKAVFHVRQVGRANQGNLEAIVQVLPVGLPARLNPFNGLFPLGVGTVLHEQSGSLDPRCFEDAASCEYDKVLAKTSNFEELKKQGYAQVDSRYYFDNIKLRFVSIEPGETTTRRTVIYSASTCISDNVDGSPLRNMPITVRYLPTMRDDPAHPGQSIPDEDDVEPKVTHWHTDESGCFKWNGKLFHYYYKPEEYFEKQVVIEKGVTTDVDEQGHQTEHPAFTRNLTFYLNPWDDKFTFGFDKREFTDDQIQEFRSRRKVPSRLFLSDYNYHTVRFLYNIDRFMELEVKKWILLGLSPQVLRYSGIQNARKNIEKLRDGIWLMKLAMEKSYLDPRDNSGWLLRDNEEYQAQIQSIGSKKLREKQYINTNISLVRVVDGVIVYPIELTMRDLRLMRVRSNFLIQLEPADERLIQAYHVFKHHQIEGQDLENKLNEFRAMEKDVSRQGDVKNLLREAPPIPDMAPILDNRASLEDPERLKKFENYSAAAQDLDKRIDTIHHNVEKLVGGLKDFFKSGGSLGNVVDSNNKPTGGTITLKTGQNITDNFELKDELLKDLKDQLKVNDFSTVGLPKKEDIDLNYFAERNSFLAPRTFVGPVIFLSNAYNDSMRATDNLDEANGTPPGGKDAMAQAIDELTDIERQQTLNVEFQLFKNRQNNAYQYNKYFNSLTHLAYKSVDDLMGQEAKLNIDRENASVAASLKYNFVDRFNMDFVSLTDEPLRKIDPKCAIFNSATQSYDHCLDEKGEHHAENHMVKADSVPVHVIKPGCKEGENCDATTEWPILKARDLGILINDNFPSSIFRDLVNGVEGVAARIRGKTPESNLNWKPEDYSRLFFGSSSDPKVSIFDEDTVSPLCNLIANKVLIDLERAAARGLVPAFHGRKNPGDDLTDKDADFSGSQLGIYQARLRSLCEDSGLVHELKYRVEKTGTYTFLGGLNLNFNVGESFSFGTSRGWSTGVDIADLVGVVNVVGRMGVGEIVTVNSLIKPFSLKYGSSMSESEGTGVSESTYLVSQVAGFDVQLKQYERCADIHLTKNALDRLGAMAPAYRMFDMTNINVYTIAARGLFICEGSVREANKPVDVPEAYFYFTQHFTEGDMLDQADLYNHPWLLALRGMRDFATFVQKVRLQQVGDFSSFGNFIKHITGYDHERPKGWALQQLANAYHGTTPTFPGYYSVLGAGEPTINMFALDQAEPGRKNINGERPDIPVLSKVDMDPIGEVTHPNLSPDNDNKARPPAPLLDPVH